MFDYYPKIIIIIIIIEKTKIGKTKQSERWRWNCVW